MAGAFRLIRKKGLIPPGPARWRPAIAGGAVLASTLGWFLAAGHGGALASKINEPVPFFIYWGAAMVAAAAVALLLGRFVTGRRWWRYVGRCGLVLGVVGFFGVLVGYNVTRATRPVPHGPNVVVIVLDAWRADAFNDSVTPELHAYAERDAVSYTQARSCASWTIPSMGSIFTGMYVDSHGYRSGPGRDVVCPTVAQVFRNAGYDTTALVANRLIDRQHTICEGFDDYSFWSWPPILQRLHFFHTNWYGPAVRTAIEVPLGWEASVELTNRFERFLDEPRRRPYFLWVHYMDPHSPYTPPPGYYRPSDERYIEPFYRHWRWRREPHHRLYLNECTFMDDLLGERILPRLEADRNTIVVITGDHGEEFWEHGTWEHGKTVYEPVIHVPMLISVPNRPAGEVVTPVSQVDLAATLLELASLPRPPGMQGKSLPLTDEEAVPKPIFVGSEFTKHVAAEGREDAIISWPYKLIVLHEDMSKPGRFFDMEEDPGELHPLPEDEVSARLRARIQQWKRLTKKRESVDRTPMEVGAEADLRALGYIQ